MNREWSRGGEPLRSREGYSELTEDLGKLFGGYLDPSSLMEPLSGRRERLFQGALNGMAKLSSSWPSLKALSSCGDGGILKQVKLMGQQGLGRGGRQQEGLTALCWSYTQHSTSSQTYSTCKHKTGLLLSQDTEEAKKTHARKVTD